MDVNGVRLHCVVEGEGPLVLLLHGFPETSPAWRNQIPELAKRFKIVAPDLRGLRSKRQAKRHPGVSHVGPRGRRRGAHRGVRRGSRPRRRPDWGGGVAWTVATLHPEALARTITAPQPARAFRPARSRRRRSSSGARTISRSGSSSRTVWMASSSANPASSTSRTRATG